MNALADGLVGESIDPSVVEVEAVLAQYRRVTDVVVGAKIAGERANPWLDDVITDYPRRAGKGLRPAILLATCQAFGGSIDDALNAAASIELLHNAFLIHDDIEDGSELRRGQPTLHRRHGVPLALNAGDALAFVAADVLRQDDRLGTRINRRIADEFRHMIRQTIDGQATELGWRRDIVVELTPTDYLDLITRKTCWYTTMYPLRVGALIGSRATVPLEQLNRFGFYLGVAFQLRDDLLNLVGSVEVYGKELAGDIREGKRTLMLIQLLDAASSDDRRFLLEFLSADEARRSDADIATVLALMERYGSIDFAIEYAKGIATAATTSFEVAFADVAATSHRRFLRSLVHYMLDRQL